jgi:PTH1 family peptidyl-tRNA hydrolase
VYLVVGLGNPGKGYSKTRHNIGFRVMESWSGKLCVRLTGHRFQAESTKARVDNLNVLLVRPLTYMNESGRSVRAFADYYHIENQSVVAVHDDLDLPLGRIKVVKNGGTGGHKGVRSIIEHLGTRDFCRVKVGIGRPRHGETVEAYVLSPFYEDERASVESVITAAVHACELLVTRGIEQAMNVINCRDQSGSPMEKGTGT